jgi:hypothetical protein
MTNTEVRDIVVAVLDAIKFPYTQRLTSNDFGVASYKKEVKCPDGKVRNTYTLGFAVSESERPLTGTRQYAIVDADTKKLVMIAGSSFYTPINYNDDGTITAGAET